MPNGEGLPPRGCCTITTGEHAYGLNRYYSKVKKRVEKANSLNDLIIRKRKHNNNQRRG